MEMKVGEYFNKENQSMGNLHSSTNLPMFRWATFLHYSMYSPKYFSMSKQLAPPKITTTVKILGKAFIRWNYRSAKGMREITLDQRELSTIFTFSCFYFYQSFFYFGRRLNCCRTFRMILRSQIEISFGFFKHLSLRVKARVFLERYRDSQKPGKYFFWIDSIIFMYKLQINLHYPFLLPQSLYLEDSSIPCFMGVHIPSHQFQSSSNKVQEVSFFQLDAKIVHFVVSITWKSPYILRIRYYYLQFIDNKVVIMSSKPKINIQKALRELNLEMTHQFEQEDYTLTEISGNLPLKSLDPLGIKSHELSQESKKSARKVISNKENQLQFDIKKVKNITYTALSKTLEQKNSLIDQQKYEIQVLKKCVEDTKSNKQVCQGESRVKSEQLVRLKLKEKEYLENLREIKLLKCNLEDIRKRYEQMASEKNALASKYNSLLSENEQLMIANTHLKHQHQTTSKNKVMQLEEQIAELKQQLRKEYLQKESIEARAVNFQKRMSEYIIKFNEAQEQYNNCQIKYYKLQKDCDNLRVDKEESEQKYSNIQKQCKGERVVHEEQSSKLKAKLKRLEELTIQQESCILNLRKVERQRFSECEQFDKLNNQLRRIKEENLRLKDQNQKQGKKWENYIKELTKQYSQEKDNLYQDLNNFRLAYTQQSQRASSFQTTNKQLSESIDQNHRMHQERGAELQKIKTKCVDLMNENERIFNHYNSLLHQKDEEVKRNRGIISHLQNQLEDKSRQEEQISQKINQLQTKLTQGNEYINEKNNALQEENRSLSKLIESLKQQHQAEIEKKQSNLNEIFGKNDQLSHQLHLCRLQKTQSSSQAEKIKQIQEQSTLQKRYYQQKYEKQLQEYNGLSQYFNQIQLENAKLLKTNTTNLIEISNLKGEIDQLQSDLSKIMNKNCQNDKSAEIASIVSELGPLKKEFDQLIQQLAEHQEKNQILTNENTQLKERLKIPQMKGIDPQRNQMESRYLTELTYYRRRLQESEIISNNYKRQMSQKEQIIGKIKEELELHVQEIRTLNINITIIEEKYRSLSYKYQQELSQWEQQRVQLEQQWIKMSETNEEEKLQLYNNRIDVAYELDNSQNAIAILKQENIELQRIFGQQIQRRNGIIRELIKQKKSLYGQFMDSKHF